MPTKLLKPCTVLAALSLAHLAMTLPAAAQGYGVIYSFCSQTGCVDGQQPNGLIEDRTGNLYGTAYEGGAHNEGVVFELSPSGHTTSYSVLYAFCAAPQCADGALPMGSLILDRKGNLYGVASEGGAQNSGEVFELEHRNGSWSLVVLYSFCAQAACADGQFPSAGLTWPGTRTGAAYDGHSPLYGTTTEGGATNSGTAFAVAPAQNGWSEQVLYSFCSSPSCSDGAGPQSPLTMDASGNLYGTTPFGGSNAGGTAFELADLSNNWTETVLHSFCSQNCADGSLPFGGLAMNAQGTLFGFANDGGVVCADTDHGPCGVIYSIVPDGTASKYAVLYTFGATLFGGTDREGVFFRLAHGALDVLHTFGSVGGDGVLPQQVMRDRSGHVLGATTGGGSGIDASGTLFEWTP